MLRSGPELFQLKLMTASVRVNVGKVSKVTLVKTAELVLAQYWPSKPVPVPVAELLMKLAAAKPLLNAPAAAAMACKLALWVKTNGPV